MTSQIVRRLLIFVLIIVTLAVSSGQAKHASALLINTQVGTRLAGNWEGIQADVVWPEPSLYTFSLQAIPVGITTFNPFPNARFVEAGPIKNCIPGTVGGDCAFHPYMSWAIPGFGAYELNVDTSRYLGSGLNYRYKVERVSPNTFTTYFCSGSGCTALMTVNIGQSTLPYLWVAAESNGEKILPASISAVQAKNSSGWFSQCYDPLLTTVTAAEPNLAHVNQCVNFSWEVRYANTTFNSTAFK